MLTSYFQIFVPCFPLGFPIDSVIPLFFDNPLMKDIQKYLSTSLWWQEWEGLNGVFVYVLGHARSTVWSRDILRPHFFLLHTQKRHRAVTACCTFRPEWYRYDIIAVSDCCRLQTVQKSELTVSEWNSLLGCQGCISLM